MTVRRSLLLLLVAAAFAGEPPPAVVCDVRVISPHVADVPSLEAWRAATIRPEMTDQQKAEAIFDSVVAFVHHDSPANEWLGGPEACVHDPIKAFNVYGYSFCCCTAAYVATLARSIGLEARGWTTPGHSVPEIGYGGGWHMLDPAFIDWFPAADGRILGVEELAHDVSGWLAAHPELADEQARGAFMRGGGWRHGPESLARTRLFDQNGWLPENGHGWYTVVAQYADPAKTSPYEYGATTGYRVANRLRHGERIVLPWANRGRFLNDREGAQCGTISAVPGVGGMAYAPTWGDRTTGRIGNGERRYDVLADGELARSAWAFDHLARETVAGGARLRASDRSHAGVLVVRMASSYVYLDGGLTARARLGGGRVAIACSDDHGRAWTELGVLAEGDSTIDLTPVVRRRYDYLLRVTIEGAATVESLRVDHLTQHSQRALPLLAAGDNEVRFAPASDEGTLTWEGAFDEDAARGKQVGWSALGLTRTGVTAGYPCCAGATGSLDLPIAVPGDLRRLRLSAHYRARDARDGWRIQVSYDGGTTFADAGAFTGPHAGMSSALTIADPPAGTRAAVVRLVGTQVNATMLFALRVDADYREPEAGFAPVRVTYAWSEGGAERGDAHVVRAPGEAWTIRCGTEPVMRSIAYALAD